MSLSQRLVNKNHKLFFFFFSVTNKIKINNSNLGLLLVYKLGTINHISQGVGVGAGHSCHIDLTDKLQRNIANFTLLIDSLSANGF